MKWDVLYYNCNANKIEKYNVLKYQEDFIKKLKKQKDMTKELFAEKLEREMMWRHWSKCEWEVIIRKDENNRVFVYPWVGCRNPEEVEIEVINDNSFDWAGFADLHINKQIYKGKAKIDAYDQLKYRWDEFVDYCWKYKHKYMRKEIYQRLGVE